MLPDLPATIQEANESSSIIADIGNYVGQMRVEFVTGTKDIDQEWDNYIAQLKKMGAEKYLEIKQTQYKRYKDS
jgi:putative aldouronate transport system substrate-binding protein